MNIHLAAFCSRTLFIYNPILSTQGTGADKLLNTQRVKDMFY